MNINRYDAFKIDVGLLDINDKGEWDFNSKAVCSSNLLVNGAWKRAKCETNSKATQYLILYHSTTSMNICELKIYGHFFKETGNRFLNGVN